MNIDEAGAKARELKLSLATARMRAFVKMREVRSYFGHTTPTAALATHSYSGGRHFFRVDPGRVFNVDLVLGTVGESVC